MTSIVSEAVDVAVVAALKAAVLDAVVAGMAAAVAASVIRLKPSSSTSAAVSQNAVAEALTAAGGIKRLFRL